MMRLTAEQVENLVENGSMKDINAFYGNDLQQVLANQDNFAERRRGKDVCAKLLKELNEKNKIKPKTKKQLKAERVSNREAWLSAGGERPATHRCSHGIDLLVPQEQRQSLINLKPNIVVPVELGAN